MPDLPKPTRRKYRPTKQVHANTSKEAATFYNSTAWRTMSQRIRQQQPTCEIGEAMGEVWPSEQVDHIIPMSKGGAPLDPRNLMAVSKYWHTRKTGKENRIELQTMRGDGGLVPLDRMEIIKYFKTNDDNE